MFFTPLIIRAVLPGAAATGPRAALLAAAPFAAGVACHAANALHSQRRGERRWHIAAPWLLGGAAMALVPVCVSRGAAGAAFGVLVVASAGINAADGPDVSWVTSLMSGPERALGLAAVNMIANLEGFVGPYAIGALSTATGSYNGAMCCTD
ncbi:MAG: hypothetical protein J3K34DRAFT_466869 [Monoraphidium minutum]|nr:MAG: hypothetical protein J3K34DRAFT_466869 [Monoraphidium minutum]